jgi:predicted anti-sigma-YlaC factor YlaD
MTCEECREAVSAAGGGQLAPDAAHHLGSCAPCREWQAALAALPATLSAWPAPIPGAEFETAILARLRRAAGAPRWARVAAEILIFALGALAGAGAVRLFRAMDAEAAGPADPAALGGAGEIADVEGLR